MKMSVELLETIWDRILLASLEHSIWYARRVRYGQPTEWLEELSVQPVEM